MSFRALGRIGLEPLKWSARLYNQPDLNGIAEPLTSGWRLVSLNEVSPGTDINSVFTRNSFVCIVLTFDPSRPGGWFSASRDEDGKLRGSLETINPKLGYWLFDAPVDPEHQLSFGHMGSEIQFEKGQPIQGWSLVSGWTLIPAREDSTATDINSVFADDDGVKRVATYNPPPHSTGLGSWIIRCLKSLNSVICGAQVVHDDLLKASRGKDGMFRGNLKTIRPELGYWVYRESSESN